MKNMNTLEWSRVQAKKKARRIGELYIRFDKTNKTKKLEEKKYFVFNCEHGYTEKTFSRHSYTRPRHIYT